MAICLHNPSCQEFLIQLIDDDEAEPMIQLLGQDKLLAKTEHIVCYLSFLLTFTGKVLSAMANTTSSNVCLLVLYCPVSYLTN